MDDYSKKLGEMFGGLDYYDEHCIGHGYLWWKYIDYERTYFLDDTLHGE